MTYQSLHATTQTAFGWIAVAASVHGLLAVTLPQTTEAIALDVLRDYAEGTNPANSDQLTSVLERLRRYYAGEPVMFDDQLDMSQATPFQRQVWQATRQIPRRVTTTYGDLAKAVGAKPSAARAIGRCMALNPWPPIVPCHRVLGKDGSLTGFGGGIAMKRRMLEMEGSMLPLSGDQREI